MSDDRPQIFLANMCQKHQYLLVHQAGYTAFDPWRALVTSAQVALFQAATCDPKTYEKIGNDVTRISEIGCLACYKPDAFGEVVEASKSGDLRDIAALGELWIGQNRKDAALGELWIGQNRKDREGS